MYASSTAFTLASSSFLENSAPAGGAVAVAALPPDASVSGCTFLRNNATDPRFAGTIGARGGAVHLVDSSAAFSLCIFMDNFVSSASPVSVRSLTPAGGGAVFAELIAAAASSLTVIIARSSFLRNRIASGQAQSAAAGTGGAVLAVNVVVQLSALSSFTNNTANFGGAIALLGDGPTSIHNVWDTSFTGNSAVIAGGALFRFGAGSTFWINSGNSFSGNRATSGGSLFGDVAFGDPCGILVNPATTFTANMAAYAPTEQGFWPSVLTVVRGSTTATSGQTLIQPLVVQLVDFNGVVVTSDNTTIVQLSLDDDSINSGGVLSGRTDVAAVNGVACFGGVSPAVDVALVGNPGASYTLQLRATVTLYDGTQREMPPTSHLLQLRSCLPGEYVSSEKRCALVACDCLSRLRLLQACPVPLAATVRKTTQRYARYAPLAGLLTCLA